MEQPTTAINPGCTGGMAAMYRDGSRGAEWQRNGRSWSCNYCGSMSTEELRVCLDAVPELDFSLNDRGDKVYVNLYPHAGDCSLYCACGRPREAHVGEPSFSEYYHKTYLKEATHFPPCSGFVHDRSKGGCACDVLRGGGPIKFYLRHVWDLAPDGPEEGKPVPPAVHALYAQVKAACLRSRARFEERFLQSKEVQDVEEADA